MTKPTIALRALAFTMLLGHLATVVCHAEYFYPGRRNLWDPIFMIPEHQRDATYLNLTFNVPSRRSEVAPARLPRDIWEAVVPREQSIIYESRFLDKRTRDFVFGPGQSNPKLFIAYDASEEVVPFRSFFAATQEPQPTSLAGIQYNSHATFRVWDRGNPTDERFIKMQTKHRLQADGSTSAHNNADLIELAVKNNDVVERILRHEPDLQIGYYPERVGVDVAIDGFRYGYIIRSTTPLVAANKPDSQTVNVPLHGFIGWAIESDHEQFKPRLNPHTNRADELSEWETREFLPKIAEFVAKMRFHHGIHIADHTQNLSVAIDPHTFDIHRIDFQDASDIVIDPFVRVRRRVPVFNEDLTGPGYAILNHSTHLAGDSIRDVASFFTYTIQTITALHDRSRSDVLVETRVERAVAYFLDLLIAEVNSIAGGKINKHEFVELRRMKALLNRRDGLPVNAADVELLDETQHVDTVLKATVARLNDQFVMTRIPRGLKPKKDASGTLEQMFRYHYTTSRVAVLGSNSGRHLESFLQGKLDVKFATASGGLYVFRAADRYPFALLYSLSPDALNQAKTILGHCRAILEGPDDGQNDK